MKVAELQGALLDYWVVRAQGDEPAYIWQNGARCATRNGIPVRYSSDWAQGGPLIESGLITLLYLPTDERGKLGTWEASFSDETGFEATNPLVAAMRAYVASTFGPEVSDEGIGDVGAVSGHRAALADG